MTRTTENGITAPAYRGAASFVSPKPEIPSEPNRIVAKVHHFRSAISNMVDDANGGSHAANRVGTQSAPTAQSPTITTIQKISFFSFPSVGMLRASKLRGRLGIWDRLGGMGALAGSTLTNC
jgi:hypothetical protein